MNMQFLVSSPLAGGTSEAFISFRVHYVYRSLTAIDAWIFSFSHLTKLSRLASVRPSQHKLSNVTP
jgi:hypothetical protein